MFRDKRNIAGSRDKCSFRAQLLLGIFIISHSRGRNFSCDSLRKRVPASTFRLVNAGAPRFSFSNSPRAAANSENTLDRSSRLPTSRSTIEPSNYEAAAEQTLETRGARDTALGIPINPFALTIFSRDCARWDYSVMNTLPGTVFHSHLVGED